MNENPARLYVAVSGIHPVAAASSLEAAQAWALAAHTRFTPAGRYEYRWKVDVPSEIWRLQERRCATGARFVSADRSVHAVEALVVREVSSAR